MTEGEVYQRRGGVYCFRVVAPPRRCYEETIHPPEAFDTPPEVIHESTPNDTWIDIYVSMPWHDIWYVRTRNIASSMYQYQLNQNNGQKYQPQ